METSICYTAGCQVVDPIMVRVLTNDTWLPELLSKKFRLDDVAPAHADLTVEIITTHSATWPVGSTPRMRDGRVYLQTECDANGHLWLASTKAWHVCFDGQDRIMLRLVQEWREEHAYDALDGLNCLLNTVLIERGLTLLHASAVEVAGKVCLIVGNSGSGKSTLAGCLAALGAGLISDDGAVLEVRDDIPLVCAGVERPLISASIETSLLIATCVTSDRIQEVLPLARYPQAAQSRWKSAWIRPRKSEAPGVLKPLGVVLFPIVIDSHAEKLSPTRVAPVDALMELTRLNISCELSPVAKVRYFRHLSLVSAKVPCLRVRLRRGHIKDFSDLRQYLEDYLV